jgi:hypothetical protein
VVGGVSGRVETVGDVTGGSVVVGAPVVGGVVVCGGAVVAGAGGCDVVAVVPDGPDKRRAVVAVVTAGRAVVAVPATVTGGVVVVETSVLLVVDSGTVDVVDVGRATVVEGMVDAWVATCCFDDPSSPVVISKRRPSMATDARA